MTINIPCWTTFKAEADKLVDKLSEVCFEYGKNENNEKLLDVFYATKALKNYVRIMQGRIESLNARNAELEAEIDMLKQLSQPIEFWSDEKIQIYKSNESRSMKSGYEEVQE